MKKVLFAISVVALALVSCAKFEPETPVTFERASAPSLTVNVTSDNSIAFEVLTGKNTGYYAYAFLKGEVDPETVDAATLLAGKLSGSVKKEVLNANDKESVQVEVKSLTANTKYTVVAVASSAGTQTLSKVVGQTVVTTDTTLPAVALKKASVSVEKDIMVFNVPFDDPITLTDKAAFIIQLFAINYATTAGTLQPLGTVPVPADSASVASDGVTLKVKVPKEVYVPGEFVALNIGPGTVKNALDSLNAAFTANTLTKKAQSGLVGRFENVNFDLENPVAEDSTVKFQNPATFEMELAADLAGAVNGLVDYGEGGITVTSIHPISGRKVEYPLEAWEIEGTKYASVLVGIDEGPEFGYYSSFTIEEGIVEDLYGNVNNALELEDVALCSYGYTLGAILGTYTFTGTSQYGVGQNDPKVVIAPSDKAGHDVMIYDMFLTTQCFADLESLYGLTFVPNAFSKFYADFDVDSGMLTVFGDVIGSFPALGEVAGAYGDGDDDEFLVAFPSAGNGVLASNVYMYFKSGGTWDVVLPGAVLTRTSTSYDYTEPAPAAPGSKKIRKGAITGYRTIENLKAVR